MTTTTQTLPDFLLARIADDEEAARAAAVIPEWAHVPADVITYGDPQTGPGRWGWSGGPVTAEDIEDFDPKLLEIFGPIEPREDPYRVSVSEAFNTDEPLGWRYDVATVPSDHDAARHIARYDPARVLAECEAKRRIVAMLADEPKPIGDDYLAILAQPYADHPDFREEWRA